MLAEAGTAGPCHKLCRAHLQHRATCLHQLLLSLGLAMTTHPGFALWWRQGLWHLRQLACRHQLASGDKSGRKPQLLQTGHLPDCRGCGLGSCLSRSPTLNLQQKGFDSPVQLMQALAAKGPYFFGLQTKGQAGCRCHELLSSLMQMPARWLLQLQA